MCHYVSVLHTSACPQSVEKGVICAGATVIVHCDLWVMGAGKQIWISGKKSKCSQQLNYLFSTPAYFCF